MQNSQDLWCSPPLNKANFTRRDAHTFSACLAISQYEIAKRDGNYLVQGKVP